MVCRHEVQASAANFHCGQKHGALSHVLELISELNAIVHGVIDQPRQQVRLGEGIPELPLNMPHLAAQQEENDSLLSQR